MYQLSVDSVFVIFYYTQADVPTNTGYISWVINTRPITLLILAIHSLITNKQKHSLDVFCKHQLRVKIVGIKRITEYF